MIISHQHKFIFLHVPKTAGSSINTFLSNYLGPNDILNGWNHPLRSGVPYNKKTLRMVNNRFGLKMISKAINLRIKDGNIFEKPIIDFALREVLKKKIGTTSIHATAKHIKKFDNKAWNEYFKFAFVRNPYTHALSHWMFNTTEWSIINDKFKKKIFTKQEFIKYLKNLKKVIKDKKNYYHDMVPFNKIYTIDGKLAVDFVGKFENLNNDIEEIKKILNLPGKKIELIHTKKKTNRSHLHLYSKESMRLVEEIWEKEFELFDYKFPYK